MPVELANFSNLPDISAKLKKKIVDAKWSWLLNLSDLAIHPHCLPFWVMLVLCKC